MCYRLRRLSQQRYFEKMRRKRETEKNEHRVKNDSHYVKCYAIRLPLQWAWFCFLAALLFLPQNYTFQFKIILEKKWQKFQTHSDPKWNVIFKLDQMKIYCNINKSKNTKGWIGRKKNLENFPTRMKWYHISSIFWHSFEKYLTVWLRSILTLSPLATHTCTSKVR